MVYTCYRARHILARMEIARTYNPENMILYDVELSNRTFKIPNYLSNNDLILNRVICDKNLWEVFVARN